MKSLHLKGYTISPGYNMLTIWAFDPVTLRRVSTTTSKPIKGLDRRNRFLVVSQKLREEGMPIPEYVPAGNP